MDPKATMDRMIDAMYYNDITELVECGHNLDGWFARGGFRPTWDGRAKVVWSWWDRNRARFTDSEG